MKWKLLYEDSIKPVRKTIDSAAYDLYAHETVTIQPNTVEPVGTGVGIEKAKKGEYLQVSLRSGSSINRGVLKANGVGIIDGDFEHAEDPEIKVLLFNRSMSMPVTIDKGERIAQAVLLKYGTMDDEEKPTTKRTGGLGSTGTK